MSFARLPLALALAAAVTFGLILLMHVLIQTGMQGPQEVPTYSVPEIVMPEREIQTEYDVSKPDRPETPEDMPPDIPQPEFDTPQLSGEGLNIRPNFDSKPQIAGPGGFGGDGEMIPLTVVQPEYPRRAAQRGLEGYCTVSLTVAASGSTKDISIADCPDTVFERASIKAAERLKYKPRVVDGQAVDVPGVQYKFIFQMAK